MTFYNSIHIQKNPDDYICRTEGETEAIDGYFDLISFDKNLGRFYFKEHLIEANDAFVEVNVFIDSQVKVASIDLSRHPALLDRLKPLSLEERSHQINIYALNFLGINSEIVENIILFDCLGISDKEDQRVIISPKGNDVDKLLYIFDKVFSGDTIKQKIEIYEKKKLILEGNLKNLNILNKIFVNGLTIKFLKCEIPMREIPSYDFIEFRIIKSSGNLHQFIIKDLINNNCMLLLDFLSSISLDWLSFIICVACSHESDKKDLVEIFYTDDVAILDKYLDIAINNAVENDNKEVLKYLLSRNKNKLGLAVARASFRKKETLIRYLLPEELNFLLKFKAKKATLFNYEIIINYFLNKSSIHIFVAIIAAVSCGREDIITNILGDEFVVTELKDFVDIIIQENRVLLNNFFNSISSRNLALIIRSASRYGHENIVRFLLSEGRSIRSDLLGGCVVKAVKYKHENIVRFLLSEGRSIDPHAKEFCLTYAYNGGCENIISMLTSKR